MMPPGSLVTFSQCLRPAQVWRPLNQVRLVAKVTRWKTRQEANRGQKSKGVAGGDLLRSSFILLGN